MILTPLITLSNGGPVDISHFRKTGNIRLLRKADVSLLKENLNIKVVGDFTEIEVEYHLKNNGKRQNIQYGFPVDAYETDWSQSSSRFPVFSKDNDFVKYFKIVENEQELKLSHWIIDSLYAAKIVNLDDIYSDTKLYTILRKWYSTTIDFQENETKIVKVNYKIKNTLRDYVQGMRFISNYLSRHFTYHLTPSSNWGDGIVGEFNLQIDVSDIASVGAEFTVKGIEGLTGDNHLFTYHSKDYDLKKSDRIHIHYNYNHLKLSNFIKESGLKNGLIKSIKSSSNNETVHHLLDKSPKTTWTSKQGDWIEIEFNKVPESKGTLLRGILALNGDYSNQENFEKSGKAKKLIITINDTTIHYDDIDVMEEEKNRMITLKKPVFKNIDGGFTSGLAVIVANGGSLLFTPEYIYKIKIQILKVDNNEKQEFTLSELYFVGW